MIQCIDLLPLHVNANVQLKIYTICILYKCANTKNITTENIITEEKCDHYKTIANTYTHSKIISPAL